MSESGRLEGKVAVVTGGSSGFGRAIATLYARHGAKVAIGDLTEDTAPGNFDDAPALATAALIARDGGEALFRRCDVSRQEDVDTLVEAAAERFGRLDVMVNNAGIWRGGPLLETTAADYQACWSVIVMGSVFGCQAAMRRFVAQNDGGAKQGGLIINIVSTAGLRGHVGQAPYNLAKAAQANLTRCVALEGAPHRVRANAICPTFMKTAMSRPGYESAQYRAEAERRLPLGRYGEASDVADAALFLASDDASFFNGALLPLDAGETLGGARQV